MAARVGVLFELLDVNAVGARDDFPIDEFETVAFGVFAVSAEFGRKTVVWTFVQADQKTLHDEARDHLQIADARDDLWVEETRVAIQFGRGFQSNICDGRHLLSISPKQKR